MLFLIGWGFVIATHSHFSPDFLRAHRRAESHFAEIRYIDSEFMMGPTCHQPTIDLNTQWGRRNWVNTPKWSTKTCRANE
jgi:hypothetical protein